MIRIMCPNLACQRILAVPAHARGKLVRCRSCSMTIRIPEKDVPEESMIRIMCPNLACQRILAVPAHARGKLVRCRSCSMTIRIPEKDVPDAAERVDQSGAP